MKTNCAVCKATSHGVFDLRETLRELEVPGTHAHPKCVTDFRRKAENTARKQGLCAAKK